ncbi:ankyrin repeat-containing domain protein [Immersiella caudata]|uniref:Ankyrin repeat-containing domain protein n=1 Tax=Immersiella caudata TaxID=314043 RepID=A0AA39WXZ0_9PEZI|nr:ankyrin repeat-containing domain protein [Immersiella caudata]
MSAPRGHPAWKEPFVEMDPLSIVASIVGITQAADRVLVHLSKLKPILTAPRDIQALVDELTDLSRVLEHLKDAINNLPRTESNTAKISADVYETLHGLVNGGGAALLMLEHMIENDFLKLSAKKRDGELKVHRLAWARKIGEVQQLRQRLRDVQLIIMVQASCINLSSQNRTSEVVDEIAVNVGRLLSRCETSQTYLMHQLQEHKDTLSVSQNRNLLEDSAFNSAKEELATSPSPLDPPPEYTTPQPPRSRDHCARRLLGSISMVVLRGSDTTSICNRANCRNHSMTAMQIFYTFPYWLLSRMLVFSLALSKSHGPEMLLRVVRIRPLDDPLFVSVRRGDIETTRSLLSTGKASVLDVTTLNRSALFYALDYQQLGVVQLLLDEGADTHQVDDTAQTPLTLALSKIMYDREDQCSSGLQDMFPSIMDILDTRGFSKLQMLVLGRQDGDIDFELKQLSQSAINAVDADGLTALYWAVCREKSDLAAKLLRAGADPNIITRFHWSPLHNAACCSLSCIKDLLDFGANVHLKTGSGRTALHILTDHANRECAPYYDLLLAKGADINARAAEGHTALHFSIMNNGGLANFSYLLKLGADPDVADNKKRHCIHYAIIWNRATILAQLLASGVDYLAVDNRKSTILHYAATYGDLGTLKTLSGFNLQSLDADSEDTDGHTAEDLADEREDASHEWRNEFKDLLNAVIWSNPAMEKLQGSMEGGFLDSEGSEAWEDALEEMMKSTTL